MPLFSHLPIKQHTLTPVQRKVFLPAFRVSVCFYVLPHKKNLFKPPVRGLLMHLLLLRFCHIFFDLCNQRQQ